MPGGIKPAAAIRTPDPRHDRSVPYPAAAPEPPAVAPEKGSSQERPQGLRRGSGPRCQSGNGDTSDQRLSGPVRYICVNTRRAGIGRTAWVPVAALPGIVSWHARVIALAAGTTRPIPRGGADLKVWRVLFTDCGQLLGTFGASFMIILSQNLQARPEVAHAPQEVFRDILGRKPQKGSPLEIR
jgi:hypothetical protein